MQSHINTKHDLVEKITKDNFKEYERFHDKYAIPLEMYYNSRNLEKEIERFRIFVFKENEVIHASIFVKKVGESAEVFGLFIDEDNTEELNSALATGFSVNDTYRCYKCIL